MNTIPEHIGIIPDGNRRWAVGKGMSKEIGYAEGLEPGLELYKLCKELGVKELTFYGFTQDNTKRPSIQRIAFQKACVDAVKLLAKEDVDLLVIGDSESPMFPEELIPFTKRTRFGQGGMKLNFLVNYGWQWDLIPALTSLADGSHKNIIKKLHSHDISRVDLIIRWGGRRRLSGFLPIQSVYSDFYILDEYWPDFRPEHFNNALEWYKGQDITLGG